MFSSEIPHDPWQPEDPDQDVNVEWARMVLTILGIILAFVLATMIGGILFFGYMVVG